MIFWKADGIVTKPYDLRFVAARHLKAVRTCAPDAALVFDTIDLHFPREYRAARLTGSVPRLQGALKLKRTELAIARAAAVTLVASDREKARLEGEDPRIAVRVVPNVHEVRSSPAGPDARWDLLFLGAYTFDPNVDAMVHFVRDVLPEVRRRLPGIRLFVAGADPTPEIHALAGEGVVVTGWYLRALDPGLRAAVIDDVVLERRLHGDNLGIRERGSRNDYVRILKNALDRRRREAPMR